MTGGQQQQSGLVSGNQLLADYAMNGSEPAFRELVGRYVDLVYSAAVRLVNGDSHLAEDVTQTVFADLARKSRSMSSGVMLGGWLHRHTVFVASKMMRAERRRQLRERQAVEMHSIEDHSAANLALLAPVLDEAINSLGSEDRSAIMLRYFEQRDLRSVGEAMGSSEDGARKRVDRALGKLEALLKRRGVTLSAAGLATVLGTSAVSAAPAGLAMSVSTAALATAATAAGGGTALTILKIMTITKAKAAILGVVLVAAVATPFVIKSQKEAAKLREENAALRKQQTEEIQQLQDEKDELLKKMGRANAAEAREKSTNNLAQEVLRLRGEVGKLRQEKVDLAASKTNGPSMLSDLRKNPGMWNMIREQQKYGMRFMYADLAKDLKLSNESSNQLTEVLADYVMNNVDRITEVLKEGKTGQDFDNAFAGEDAALLEKLKDVLGAENVSKFQDYSHNMAAFLTSVQFKEMMTGDKDAKDEKAKQLRSLVEEETRNALANAGLPADYQVVPMLNFRNFASEAEEEKSLKLLDSIYERVAARASFLSPEDLKSFTDFRKKAQDSSKMALTLNRKMMAPGAN